ncbi:DMT family transporter [Mesorhizobium caraganae]|nr:DMT family transporter [Mesorhizobium caraganae]
MPTSQTALKEDRVAIAVAAMVFTDVTLSIADAIIKVTLSHMPLSQFIFLRSCVTLPLLISILRWRLPQVPLRPAYPGWAIVRSSLLLSSLLIYYASLPHLDFSMAAAVYYTIPLFITLFAAFGIREPVGVQGWVGVALGFVGVLLMLKPQAGDLSICGDAAGFRDSLRFGDGADAHQEPRREPFRTGTDFQPDSDRSRGWREPGDRDGREREWAKPVHGRVGSNGLDPMGADRVFEHDNADRQRRHGHRLPVGTILDHFDLGLFLSGLRSAMGRRALLGTSGCSFHARYRSHRTGRDYRHPALAAIY